LVPPLHYRREVVTMKKDVPIEIEIEVVEAGQPPPKTRVGALWRC
jgi:hypothetical protein